MSCFASNKALDERKGTHLKQTTTINVKFKPEILKPNGTTEIIHAIEGEVVTLTCNFKANPMVGANIKWYKNGHLLESNPQQEGMYNSRFRIFFSLLVSNWREVYSLGVFEDLKSKISEGYKQN